MAGYQHEHGAVVALFYSISSATYPYTHEKGEPNSDAGFFHSLILSVVHCYTVAHTQHTFVVDIFDKCTTETAYTFGEFIYWFTFFSFGPNHRQWSGSSFFSTIRRCCCHRWYTGTAHDITNIPRLRYQIEECIIVCYWKGCLVILDENKVYRSTVAEVK